MLNDYNVYFPLVHRANGFRWHRPRSWIERHKLYVRVDNGNSDITGKTQEIKGTGTTFEWNEDIP